jgi:hypothetical protein
MNYQSIERKLRRILLPSPTPKCEGIGHGAHEVKMPL